MPKGKMTKEQRDRWKPYAKITSGSMTEKHYKLICELHADLYAHKYHEICTCSPKRLKEWIYQINKIYDTQV